MNRIVKVFIISSFVVLGLAIVGGLLLFHQLPSLKAISNVLGSKKKSLTASGLGSKKMAPDVSASAPESLPGFVAAEASNPANDKPEAGGVISDRFLEDMMSRDKPLSDFCNSISSSRSGAFTTTEFNKAFAESFESAKPDPRIQAAKPLLRYVFRLPKMQQLFSSLSEVAAKNDESLIDKAQFYTAAVGAYSEMRDHQVEIEAVLDRSYLLMGVNNLVAKRPDLVTDPRVLTYCETTETLFNQSATVDFETEKNNFLNLLKDSSVTPKEISFNPNYKSNLIFNFDGKSLTFSGGWLDELIRPEPDALPADLGQSITHAPIN